MKFTVVILAIYFACVGCGLTGEKETAVAPTVTLLTEPTNEAPLTAGTEVKFFILLKGGDYTGMSTSNITFLNEFGTKKTAFIDSKAGIPQSDGTTKYEGSKTQIVNEEWSTTLSASLTFVKESKGGEEYDDSIDVTVDAIDLTFEVEE